LIASCWQVGTTSAAIIHVSNSDWISKGLDLTCL